MTESFNESISKSIELLKANDAYTYEVQKAIRDIGYSHRAETEKEWRKGMNSNWDKYTP